LLPPPESADWKHAETLLSALCGQALKMQCGYAESQLKVIITPRE
jgi:hypothetical protein